MRSSRRFLGPLAAILLATAAPRPADAAWLVAQLAPAPGAGTAARGVPVVRAARADAAALAAAAPRLAALGLSPRGALLDGLPAPAANVRPAAMPDGFAPERVVLLEAPGAPDAAAATRALAASGAVEWAEPLRLRTPAAAPLDSLPDESLLRDGHQWFLWNLGAAGGSPYGGIARADAHVVEAWRVTTGDERVKLAIADTGIDPAQPELGGTLADGSPRLVDAINVTSDPDPSVTDLYGHGTPVAGVAAARTNDGPHASGRGVAGVCGGDGVTSAGCRIVPIKIAPGHSGDASSFDIARAMMHAADVGARAMNLSFAGPEPSRLERFGLAYAIVRGCVVVVAAGNKGAGAFATEAQYPAAYAADGLCIQVGASDESDKRTVWSSYGPGLDLLAPGTDMWAPWMTYPSFNGASYDGYVPVAGTSYAAPVVTGAIGLLASARPELTDTDFQHLLRESAHDVGDPGVDAKTGWGRLDVGAALAAVGPRFGIWHDEVGAQSFAPDTTVDTLRIGESGPGTLDRWSGAVPARRWAVTSTVTLPDSFAWGDSVRVWLRIGGTLSARGDYQLPYFQPTAIVSGRGSRTFTLRGWLYRTELQGCSSCPEPWIPLPPEYVRFGFTVIGPVARGPASGVAGTRLPAALLAGPNPFRGSLALRLPAAGEVRVLDAAGRVVRAFRSGAGDAHWDGRDDDGRDARPGLYFVRWRGGPESRTVRVVKLGT